MPECSGEEVQWEGVEVRVRGSSGGIAERDSCGGECEFVSLSLCVLFTVCVCVCVIRGWGEGVE
jgi:hypothetical protein